MSGTALMPPFECPKAIIGALWCVVCYAADPLTADYAQIIEGGRSLCPEHYRNALAPRKAEAFDLVPIVDIEDGRYG